MKKGMRTGNKYKYLGDRLTDPDLKGRTCYAILNSKGKCIRGKNSNMLVLFGNKPQVILARLLRKI